MPDLSSRAARGRVPARRRGGCRCAAGMSRVFTSVIWASRSQRPSSRAKASTLMARVCLSTRDVGDDRGIKTSADGSGGKNVPHLRVAAAASTATAARAALQKTPEVYHSVSDVDGWPSGMPGPLQVARAATVAVALLTFRVRGVILPLHFALPLPCLCRCLCRCLDACAASKLPSVVVAGLEWRRDDGMVAECG